ncbi:hypothetical protein X975_08381, partial [Stegodyphus mimosarum]
MHCLYPSLKFMNISVLCRNYGKIFTGYSGTIATTLALFSNFFACKHQGNSFIRIL